jgi:hemoglobin
VTLHAWTGGDPASRRLIDVFYDRVERDDLLSPFFPGGVSEEHRAHVTRWWIEVFGGASTYTDELGGYENMLATTEAWESNPTSGSGSRP